MGQLGRKRVQLTHWIQMSTVAFLKLFKLGLNHMIFYFKVNARLSACFYNITCIVNC